MRRVISIAAIMAAVGMTAGCQKHSEVGPIVHRDGLISGVIDDGVHAPRKDIILTGTDTCNLVGDSNPDKLNVEINGNITQGSIRSTLEGGFDCTNGQTTNWTDNFGHNGTFPPDPRLQPGKATVTQTFYSPVLDDDQVTITREVTLTDS